MRSHTKNIEHNYPENIQLIDEAFDRFEWESYPQEHLSIDDVDGFYLQAIQMKHTNVHMQNLSNPYAAR